MLDTCSTQRELIGRTADLIDRAHAIQDDARRVVHAARNTRHHAALLRELSRRTRILQEPKTR